MISEDLKKKLREKGLKVTPLREQIVRLAVEYAAAKSPEVMTAIMVYKIVQERTGRSCQPSIYRNLEELSDAGILRRVPVVNGSRSYAIVESSSAESGRYAERAWKLWQQSDEGKCCGKADTINIPREQQQYLINRLYRAFMAGFNASEERHEG